MQIEQKSSFKSLLFLFFIIISFDFLHLQVLLIFFHVIYLYVN